MEKLRIWGGYLVLVCLVPFMVALCFPHNHFASGVAGAVGILWCCYLALGLVHGLVHHVHKRRQAGDL
jgi:hypothetical protein